LSSLPERVVRAVSPAEVLFEFFPSFRSQ
jgi:hypothetical protein